jgi:hypothetical protein
MWTRVAKAVVFGNHAHMTTMEADELEKQAQALIAAGRAVANGEQGALAKVFDKGEGRSMVANQTVVAHQG